MHSISLSNACVALLFSTKERKKRKQQSCAWIVNFIVNCGALNISFSRRIVWVVSRCFDLVCLFLRSYLCVQIFVHRHERTPHRSIWNISCTEQQEKVWMHHHFNAYIIEINLKMEFFVFHRLLDNFHANEITFPFHCWCSTEFLKIATKTLFFFFSSMHYQFLVYKRKTHLIGFINLFL